MSLVKEPLKKNIAHASDTDQKKILMLSNVNVRNCSTARENISQLELLGNDVVKINQEIRSYLRERSIKHNFIGFLNGTTLELDIMSLIKEGSMLVRTKLLNLCWGENYLCEDNYYTYNTVDMNDFGVVLIDLLSVEDLLSQLKKYLTYGILKKIKKIKFFGWDVLSSILTQEQLDCTLENFRNTAETCMHEQIEIEQPAELKSRKDSIVCQQKNQIEAFFKTCTKDGKDVEVINPVWLNKQGFLTEDKICSELRLLQSELNKRSFLEEDEVGKKLYYSSIVSEHNYQVITRQIKNDRVCLDKDFFLTFFGEILMQIDAKKVKIKQKRLALNSVDLEAFIDKETDIISPAKKLASAISYFVTPEIYKKGVTFSLTEDDLFNTKILSEYTTMIEQYLNKLLQS